MILLNKTTDPQLQSVGSFIDVLLSWLYQILWIYPIYSISFILNAIWYQDIADHAFITRGGKRKTIDFTFQRWVNAMAEELYRTLLFGSFMVQKTLSSFIPYIGFPISTIHLCWIYSLYSFEYKWALEGWSLEKRLVFFETRWAYFAGFGLPAALLSILFPRFISAGIFAFTFPLFIILAIVAHPIAHNAALLEESKQKKEESPAASAPAPVSLTARLPIFKYSLKLNEIVVKCLRRTRS